MRCLLNGIITAAAGLLLCVPLHAQEPAPAAGPSPAAGYDIHVTAPHVVEGEERGPFHHYCKPISPEPVIQCLIFESTEPGAPLTQIEYMVAKSLTRSAISRDDWNDDWHDHAVEIAGGRVQVHDLPEAEAAQVAELAATTDGVIFHLWPHGSSIPTGEVSIAQAVGHVELSEEEYAASAAGGATPEE
ncbi:MAG TPA: DUF1264 domain-containing protein [Gemmatimonadota bacterium]|nr:DUF1264 domain-containing protein [Gemmatimonadota bacterium]